MKEDTKTRFRFKKLCGAEDYAVPFDFTHSTPVLRPATDNLQNWIRFYLYKEVIGIESPHTARAKAYDLHKLLVFYELTKGSSIAVWDKVFTNSFVNALEKEYAIGSVYRIFATVTNFVSFLILLEAIKPTDNPTAGIRLLDHELPPPQGVQVLNKEQTVDQLSSREIYDRLIAAAQSFIDEKYSAGKKDRTLPRRDLAIVALLYNTGLRVDEVCSITLPQLDGLNNGDMWIRNIKCKGKKVRKAFLKKSAVDVLLKYLDEERTWRPGFVFESWRRQKLNQPDIWRILQKIAGRAQQSLPPGTVIDIHPHSLRHERGYNLRKAGLGDAMIAEQLGHSGTGQVARYSRRSEEDEADMLKDI
jgi:integrase